MLKRLLALTAALPLFSPNVGAIQNGPGLATYSPHVFAVGMPQDAVFIERKKPCNPAALTNYPHVAGDSLVCNFWIKDKVGWVTVHGNYTQGGATALWKEQGGKYVNVQWWTYAKTNRGFNYHAAGAASETVAMGSSRSTSAPNQQQGNYPGCAKLKQGCLHSQEKTALPGNQNSSTTQATKSNRCDSITDFFKKAKCQAESAAAGVMGTSK